MLILARVCADFYDRNRNLLHRILPVHLGTFHEAPDSIRQDPLFQMLVDDGSIKYPADAAKDRALEQDPYAGADVRRLHSCYRSVYVYRPGERPF